jgi:hypothetical protein
LILLLSVVQLNISVSQEKMPSLSLDGAGCPTANAATSNREKQMEA